MKKLALLIPLMILMACGTYKTFSVASLRLGMTKADVEQMSGTPRRILAVSQTEYGCQEILEYKTPYDEIYALEFMNDHLVRYEFLSKEVRYIPYPPPPPVIVHPNPPKPVERPAPKPTPPSPPRPDDQNKPAQENSQARPPSRRPDSGVTNQASPSESTGQVKSGESDNSSQRPTRRSRK